MKWQRLDSATNWETSGGYQVIDARPVTPPPAQPLGLALVKLFVVPVVIALALWTSDRVALTTALLVLPIWVVFYTLLSSETLITALDHLLLYRLRAKEIEARLVSDLAQTHMQRTVSLARAELAAELTDTGGRAELRWIVPTFYRDTNLGRDILESLCRAFGDKVTDAVRLTVRLGEAARAGKTIFEYDPQGNGATDYAAVAKRVNYGW